MSERWQETYDQWKLATPPEHEGDDEMNATDTAWGLYENWKHLPRGECFDQIEWHMESDGFTGYEIGCALDEIDAATFS